MKLDLVDTDVKVYESIQDRADEPMASEEISLKRAFTALPIFFYFFCPNNVLIL